MNYTQCVEPQENQALVSLLTIYMKKRIEYADGEEYSVSLHGSLLLQNMLKFNKPIKVSIHFAEYWTNFKRVKH